MKKITLL